MAQEKNIRQFNQDVEANAGYCYSSPNAKLSSRLANQRLSDAVKEIAHMNGKRVIDVGCGDGTYTLELMATQPRYVLGVDAAAAAVQLAKQKSQGIADIEFRAISVYDLLNLGARFDIAIVRGLLHHLYDVKKAIAVISKIAREAVMVEPNGYNPILKVIEKVSPYHVQHEERSYFPHQLNRWFAENGGRLTQSFYCGLVPFFCPDRLSTILKKLEPFVETIPLLRHLTCAVYVFKIRFD